MLRKLLPLILLSLSFQPAFSQCIDRWYPRYIGCDNYLPSDRVICYHPFQLILQVSDSCSQESHIHADSNVWDPSPQVYSDDLGNSVLYAAGFGYRYLDAGDFNPIII